MEGFSGQAATKAKDDTYYLNRVRFEATIRPSTRVEGFVQMQDAEVSAYGLGTPPVSIENKIDLRQAYAAFSVPGPRGVMLRAGRQELVFGEQRLVGNGDWGNVARVFDGARGAFYRPGVRIDAFVVLPARLVPDGFDRTKTDETFWGAVGSTTKLLPHGTLEPYALVKRLHLAIGETGTAGSVLVATYGARAVGLIAAGFDYNVEAAWQTGHVATDTLRAWAGHYALGRSWATAALAPRVTVEVNHASGDDDPRNERLGTFDQLYPTNHNKYGIADQMGWRNMRDAMIGVQLSPNKKAKISTEVHHLLLATTNDGLYVDNGTRRVLNRAATSRDVGTELDLFGAYAWSSRVNVGAGVGYLVAGEYLNQSTGGGAVWAPYVMWNVKF
ncbi:MAG: alginate export family protein [Vicinamibacterales bacterium]